MSLKELAEKMKADGVSVCFHPDCDGIWPATHQCNNGLLVCDDHMIIAMAAGYKPVKIKQSADVRPAHLEEEGMVKLMDYVKDKITGFEGTVTGRTTYLNGCVQVYVKPNSLNKDGEMPKGYWFDEPQVQVLKSAAVEECAPAGGPRPTPQDRETPPER